MPLGNLTSQFFANVYLNEFDQFVKHKLKAKYYIRYVDDFVILHGDSNTLKKYKEEINVYLTKNLKIGLHSGKSKIIELSRGINLLGYRTFYHYKLLRKSNKRKFERKFSQDLELYKNGAISHEAFVQKLHGWLGYSIWANTYKMKKRIFMNISLQVISLFVLSRSWNSISLTYISFDIVFLNFLFLF